MLNLVSNVAAWLMYPNVIFDRMWCPNGRLWPPSNALMACVKHGVVIGTKAKRFGCIPIRWEADWRRRTIEWFTESYPICYFRRAMIETLVDPTLLSVDVEQVTSFITFVINPTDKSMQVCYKIKINDAFKLCHILYYILSFLRPITFFNASLSIFVANTAAIVFQYAPWP
jgi:hypothetical protein